MPDPGYCWQTKAAFINSDLTMSRALKTLFSDPGGRLLELAGEAKAASELAAVVRRSLPAVLQPHVLTAVRRGDDLVVIVDSAAWAARVRYAGPRLRERLEQAGQTVEGKVRVRVGRPVSTGATGN
jgi:hypothetical protein